jgi:hypothetical protein
MCCAGAANDMCQLTCAALQPVSACLLCRAFNDFVWCCCCCCFCCCFCRARCYAHCLHLYKLRHVRVLRIRSPVSWSLDNVWQQVWSDMQTRTDSRGLSRYITLHCITLHHMLHTNIISVAASQPQSCSTAC